MNINRIFIKQVRNSGVVKVQYIKWTGAPSDGNYAPALGRVIYNVTKVRLGSRVCPLRLTRGGRGL